MKSKKIENLLKCFNEKNILIIGDVMIDSYMEGKVNRISPEAPIPIVSINGQENRLGGASNVALNIKCLGAKPIMCSVIGDNDNGEEFLRLLKKENLNTNGILKKSSRRTTVKTRIISDQQHLLRVDEEDTSALDKNTEEEFLKHISYTLENENIDAIIFEDYDKGVITPEIIKSTVNIANKKNIPVSADPKSQNFLNYKGVTLFKPNYKEMQEGMKTVFAKDNFAAVKGVSQRFLQETGTEILLLTLADAGAIISDREKTLHIPAEIRNIADVSGAGDTVIATATLCISCGLNLYETAFIANMAGGIVCEYSGVVPVKKEDLLKELSKSELADHSS